MDNVYTSKQMELLRIWQRGDLKRINLLSGSVRSGKTWISLVLWAFWVAMRPADGSYLMAAKTLTALHRNCLNLLQELVGENNFSFSISKKEGMLFGRKVYFEGVNDIRAENKIRGLTLDGAYCDELTLFSEDFFAMLLSRLSKPGAKLFATTNPDSPYHWLKVNYIDAAEKRGLSLLFLNFLLEDNTTLDAEYVENLKKEYTGVFYDRFILGRWVVAEGLIYSMFNPSVHVKNLSGMKFDQYYISVDYGTQNPTVFLLFGHCAGKWYGIKEYYYSGRERQKQKTDGEYADDMMEFIGDIPYTRIIIDPSAASFIAELKKRGLRVKAGKNDVIDGIRFAGSLFAKGDLYLSDSMKRTISEIQAYTWDPKATEKGEDKPLKENDHCMDAMRYFAYTVLKGGGVSILK